MRDPQRDLGSACAYIRSRSWVLLVRETNRINAKRKLPGGQIEPGEGVKTALIRELREEIGRRVRREALRYHVRQTHESGSLRHCYTVEVSDEWFDRCPSVGNENGQEMEILKIPRPDVLSLVDIPEPHRQYIRYVESQPT